MENLEHQSVGVHNAGDQIKHTLMSSGEEQVNKAEADVSTSADHNGENRWYANALIQRNGTDSYNEAFLKPGKRPNRGMSKNQGLDQAVISRPTRTGGTGDSLLLTSGPKTFQVQITNVNSELDNITELIDNKEIGITASSIKHLMDCRQNNFYSHLIINIMIRS